MYVFLSFFWAENKCTYSPHNASVDMTLTAACPASPTNLYRWTESWWKHATIWQGLVGDGFAAWLLARPKTQNNVYLVVWLHARNERQSKSPRLRPPWIVSKLTSHSPCSCNKAADPLYLAFMTRLWTSQSTKISRKKHSNIILGFFFFSHPNTWLWPFPRWEWSASPPIAASMAYYASRVKHLHTIYRRHSNGSFVFISHSGLWKKCTWHLPRYSKCFSDVSSLPLHQTSKNHSLEYTLKSKAFEGEQFRIRKKHLTHFLEPSYL